MSRKAISFILGLVIAVAAAGAARHWLRRPPATALASNDAMQFVSWAMHACYGTNRIGEQVTTIAAGSKQVTTRVEIAYRRPGMMRMRYLSGPAQLMGGAVWQDLHRVYRYLPDKHRLEVNPKEASRPVQLEHKLQLLEQNYTATREGVELVAGRPAYRIILRPRRPGNPSKRLWIDRQTFLMLGSEDYDSHEHLLRSTRYTTLALRDEPETTFHPPLAYLKRVTSNPAAEGVPLPRKEIARRVGFEVLLPRYVPPGYRLVGSFVNRDKCSCGDEAARSEYTDGVSTISVFQCGHPCTHGGSCWGTSVPGGVRISNGPDSFMLVGELDRAELLKMAHSLPARTPQIALRR